MGEPKTKSAMANQSHAGSGGYQDSYGMEEKAARHAVEASGDPSVDQAVSFPSRQICWSEISTDVVPTHTLKFLIPLL